MENAGEESEDLESQGEACWSVQSFFLFLMCPSLPCFLLERAAKRTESRKLAKYIRLADYFVRDTLVTLCFNRTSDLVKLVNPPPAPRVVPTGFTSTDANPASSVVSANASLLALGISVASLPEKKERPPLFLTEMRLGSDQKLCFEPNVEEFKSLSFFFQGIFTIFCISFFSFACFAFLCWFSCFASFSWHYSQA